MAPMKPEDVLQTIADKRGDAIVVPTMTAAPAWRLIAPGDLSVTCVGFMGGASSLGLGLALARPDRRVLVLDGDGSLLMQLGSLATVAEGAGYRAAFAVHQLDDLKRRLPEILTAEGPLLVELHTGLAEKTPMTFRDRTPLHQQIHDARVKLLRPRASAAPSA
jgi:TPP-dependent trihydroxycyclohexane-1,2-dione (THcHDO) dehydratase